MSKEVQEFEFSDEETLVKAIGLIRKGSTEEEVQKKFNLTYNDMDLIDFIINEL